MSAAKGGRKVVKANRVSRSKPGTKTLLRPSAPLCVPVVEADPSLEIIGNFMVALDECESALCDLMCFYDRVAGNIKDGTGWSVAEVRRLAEIRALIAGPPVPANSSPTAPQTPPEAMPGHVNPESLRKSAPRP